MTKGSIFLGPGEIVFGDDFDEISTILGSCVAVILRHRAEKIVGVCHVQFPTAPTSKNNFGYAENAIRFFVESIKKYKTIVQDYEVSIYGGGNMFPGIDKAGKEGVGEKNAKKVLKCLELYGFKVETSDIGGTQARKLRINRVTGIIKCEYVKASY